MPIHDISVPVENRLVTWPSDPSITVERTSDVCCGDAATVSFLKMGSHTGTHVDAFSHFKSGAQTLDAMALDIYVGKAKLVEIENPQAVTVEELSRHDWTGVERVLFKTANSQKQWSREPFNEHFCHIHPRAAEFLIEKGVKLVGVDYLSVEGFHAKELYHEDAPTHHRLIDGGVYIVEGLYLGGVAPGWYELICLPLKIQDGDGAPARVILRDLPGDA